MVVALEDRPPAADVGRGEEGEEVLGVGPGGAMLNRRVELPRPRLEAVAGSPLGQQLCGDGSDGLTMEEGAHLTRARDLPQDRTLELPLPAHSSHPLEALERDRA